MSLMVKKLPSDFDIFSLLTFTKPLWTQNLASGLPVAPSDWAISFSWWGNIKSSPPPWISKVSPRKFWLIIEHSICHPGLPLPQGLSHHGSPSLLAFHRAKSRGYLFFSLTSTRAPAIISSRFLPESFPYPLNFSTA